MSQSPLDHVRSYYQALNTGDADRVSAHFTEDATHYYTRLGPHEGGRTIGEHTNWAVENMPLPRPPSPRTPGRGMDLARNPTRAARARVGEN